MNVEIGPALQALESRKPRRHQHHLLGESAARAVQYKERAAVAEVQASSRRRAAALSRRVLGAQAQALLLALDTLQVRV